MVELIAHRAGNSRAATECVRAVADVVEIDLHLHRGHVVVRHAKRLWPTGRLWERWYLLPRGTPVPDLVEALDWLGPRSSLWVDCKGPVALGLPGEVLRLVGSDRELTLSGKAWWVLARAAGTPGVRLVRSAGNRAELFLLLRLPSRVPLDGVALHERLLTPALVTDLRARFGRVYCWAVDDEPRARELVGWGVAGLIMDDPALMQALAEPAVETDQAGRDESRQGQADERER